MPARNKTPVTVHLDRDELAALAQTPGTSNAARLRALIHSEAIADAIGRHMEGRLGPRIQALSERLDAVEQKLETVADEQRETAEDVRAIGSFLKHRMVKS